MNETLETVVNGLVWVSGIVIPAWIIRTSSRPGEKVAAAIILVLALLLAYRVGRVSHPDRPAWKDRPPGFSRVMLKWETEYHTEMQAREQSEVVSYSEWLNAKESRGQRLREWLDTRSER